MRRHAFGDCGTNQASKLKIKTAAAAVNPARIQTSPGGRRLCTRPAPKIAPTARNGWRRWRFIQRLSSQKHRPAVNLASSSDPRLSY